MILKLGVKHHGMELYRRINYSPGVTLTYLILDFPEIFVACGLKIGRHKQFTV